MIGCGDVGERAERLRVLLKLYRGAPLLNPAETLEAGVTLLSAHEVALLAAVGADDLALAGACLSVEHELREEGYEALQALLALLPGGEGVLPERVLALPEYERLSALARLFEVGWGY